MSFFDLFKSPSAQLPKAWRELESLDQLDDVLAGSADKPVAIFKHSTRCGTSSWMLNEIVRSYDLEDNTVDFYYLDLLKHRDVSNRIADVLSVPHQSPQLILVKDNKAGYHSSHAAISLKKLKSHL